MGYHIEPCSGAEQVDEIAGFLAQFVADGEGNHRDPVECQPETWAARLRWWWETNPFCRPDSPKALLLRREGGDLAGIFGYIPHDYVIGGELVPSLISTTTFVRRDSREAALGLFLRAHRLRGDFQIVDGGPNEEAQALLKKTGYDVAEKTRYYLYPVRRRAMRPQSWLFQIARTVTPKSNGAFKDGAFVTSLDEVQSIPRIRDPRLRKHVDRNTLSWYLTSGSQPKHFVGWTDTEGNLLYYLLGTVRRRKGLTVFSVIDAMAFDPLSDHLLDEFIAHVATHPGGAGIPDGADVIAWPAPPARGRRRPPFSISNGTKVFYRLPPQLGDVERLTTPFEGDQILL